MLILAILNLIVAFPTVLLSLFPHITALPWGLDSMLVSGVGYIHYLANIIPPLGILLTAFSEFMVFYIAMRFIRLIPWVGKLFT